MRPDILEELTMSLRTLAAALLPLTFALFLIAAPAVAGSDKDKDVDFGGNDGPSQAVPEPTALVVFGAGAAGVAWATRRRSR